MKVEYLLKLFNHFNKQIWTNKIFSYFLIAIIIGYTIALRQHPDIYYKYIYNPLILIILILCIMLIAKYNIPLGFMLTFSLVALYFPKIHNNDNINQDIEGFENEDKVKTPLFGEDKNIVDDEKKNKKPQPTKKNSKSEDEEEEEAEVEEKPTKSSKKESEEDEDEVKDIGLEKLNPGYYKNKNKNSTTATNKTNTKKKDEDVEKDKTTKKETFKSKDSETFLGDVRQVIKDLDTGRGGMNASGAIKSINDLFYNKHKTNIKKMIQQDDEESEDDDDEDFF